MDVALALFVLAPARAITVQQPMHAEFLIALAVVVQGLATELQRLGQTRLVDPVLDQLYDQEPTRGLIAQIDPFAQAAVMIHITLPARAMGKVQPMASAELETLAQIIDEYHADHPEVFIDVVTGTPATRGDRIRALLAAGADAGIFEIEASFTREWAEAGYLLPLDDVFQ
ncbi:MAG: hypothetical protein P8Y25_12370, partial [Chromatiaceae bacterium]